MNEYFTKDYMRLLSIFPLRVLIFGFTLSGYGVISFLVSDANSSQLVTIPFRAVILVLNLILTLYNLGIIYSSNRSSTLNTIKDLTRKLPILLLVTFILSYSFRMVYEIFVNPSVSLSIEPFQYLIFWFLITLIPGLNFLFVDYSKSEKYLFFTWFIHLIMGVLAISINPSQDAAFYNDQGRLAGAALNPISMGQYGASLFLLSLYIWLNFQKFSSNGFFKKIRFVYLASAFIGLVVCLLAGSRGPITGLVVCLLLIIVSRKIDLKLLYLIVLILCGVFYGVSLTIEKGGSFLDRFLLSGDEFDTTGQGRGAIFDTTINLISDNLLTGVGLEIPDYGYPHNIVLESFLPLGVLGGLFFITLLLFGIVKSIQLIRDSKGEGKWGWLGILFIQYTVISLSSGSLYGSSIFWYLIIAILGFDEKVANKQSSRLKEKK